MSECAQHAYEPSLADMKAVRNELTAQERIECSDEMINRVLRADKGNRDLATARLKETLKWRREVRPCSMVCKQCLKNPRSHYLHPIGFARTGMPVMYSCFALCTDRATESNKEHMIMTFEQTIKLMPEGVEKWIWFSDFAGFGFRDMGVGIAKAFLELASKHYPERLGIFCLVGAPAMFSVLWNAILPFVDPVTKAKIRVLPYDLDKPNSELQKFFDSTMTAETAEWIAAEMVENRKQTVVKGKQYCQRQIYEAVKVQGLTQRHWGSATLLQKLAESPECLHPQGTQAAE